MDPDGFSLLCSTKPSRGGGSTESTSTVPDQSHAANNCQSITEENNHTAVHMSEALTDDTDAALNDGNDEFFLDWHPKDDGL